MKPPQCRHQCCWKGCLRSATLAVTSLFSFPELVGQKWIVLSILQLAALLTASDIWKDKWIHIFHRNPLSGGAKLMHYLWDLCGNYFCFPSRSGTKWQLKSAHFFKSDFFSGRNDFGVWRKMLICLLQVSQATGFICPLNMKLQSAVWICPEVTNSVRESL